MISEIKIDSHRVIYDSTLDKLGQINVFCGVNSSGKSLVLRDFSTNLGTGNNNEIQAGIQFKLDELLGIVHPEIDVDANTVSQELSYRLLESGSQFEDESKTAILYRSNLPVRNGVFHVNADSSASDKAKFVVDNIFRDSRFVESFPDENRIHLVEESRNIAYKSQLGDIQDSVVRQLFKWKNTSPNETDPKNLNVLYNRVRNEFVTISGDSTFDIELQNGELVANFSRLDKANWIAGENCGYGLMHLLIILTSTLSPDYDILIIDEPDAHLHPLLQRRLLRFFRSQEDKQFFIATHSNIFLNVEFVDRIFYCEYDGKINVSDRTSRAAMLTGLGYSVADGLIADCHILVEGSTDIPVIKHFLSLIDEMEQYHIQYWILGGSSMNNHDLSHLKGSNNVIALLDNESQQERVAKKFIGTCEEFGIEVHQLAKRAIENYFTVEAIRKVGFIIDDTVTKLDPQESVKKQVRLKNHEDDPKIKADNYKIVKHMTLEDIEETDFHDFLRIVESKCKSHNARP